MRDAMASSLITGGSVEDQFTEYQGFLLTSAGLHQ